MPSLVNDDWLSLGAGAPTIELRTVNQSVLIAYSPTTPSALALNVFVLHSWQGAFRLPVLGASSWHMRRLGAVPIDFSISGDSPEVAAIIAGEVVALAISGLPPAGVEGVAYSFVPSVTGGAGTRSFTLSAGVLPAGLSFSTVTGAITGTPTAAGTTAGLSITVTDASGSVTLSGLSISIGAAGAAYNGLLLTIAYA